MNDEERDLPDDVSFEIVESTADIADANSGMTVLTLDMISKIMTKEFVGAEIIPSNYTLDVMHVDYQQGNLAVYFNLNKETMN